MPLAGLFKPEYLLRPSNVLARLRFRDTRRLPATLTIAVRGRPFRINPDEVIGRHLLHFGLFDLTVTEALLRLADPGELAADVGANVGYMACVLADAVGSQGRVIAFEPHPEIFAELAANTLGLGVEAKQAAVSDRAGVVRLHIPEAFVGNRGIASLEALGDASEDVEVDAVSLDEVLAGERPVGVMKIDIEGHELAALRGAENLLRGGRIRDIVFEEHNPAQSAVARHLADRGYRIFRLHKGFFGPKLLDPEASVSESRWESPSLLATLDPARAQTRFAARGWTALRGA